MSISKHIKEHTVLNTPSVGTDASGATVLMTADGANFNLGKSLGNRVLLLGDSMVLAHNNTLTTTSMTLQRTSNVTTVTKASHSLINRQRITVT